MPERVTSEQVSVVIPAFNARAVIARALGSVLAQSSAPAEVIVVDDGSSDGTEEVVGQVGGVRYVRQKNAGPSAARNRGADVASGELLYFLDADDELLPRGLEHLCAAMGAFREAGAASGALLYDAGGPLRRLPAPGAILGGRGRRGLVHDFFEVARRHYIAASGSVLMRADAFRAVGGFRADLRMGEDTNLWSRIAGRFPWAFVDEAVFAYHHHPCTSMTRRVRESDKPTNFLLSEPEMRRAIREELWRSYRSYRRDAALTQARDALHQGARRAARELMSGIAPAELTMRWIVTSGLAALPAPISRGALTALLRLREAAARLRGREPTRWVGQ